MRTVGGTLIDASRAILATLQQAIRKAFVPENGLVITKFFMRAVQQDVDLLILTLDLAVVAEGFGDELGEVV